MTTNPDREAAIKKLKRTFGDTLDRDVLESVLEIHNGDVAAATSFLTADAGGYAFNPNQESSLPSDYPGQVKLSSAPSRYGHNRAPATTTTTTSTSTTSSSSAEATTSTSNEVEQHIKSLFLQESTFMDHYNAQRDHYDIYAAVVLLLTKFNVEIKQNARTRMLAASWARHDDALANYLLEQEEYFNLPQVLGAVNLLDAARKVRALNNKIQRLEKQGHTKAKTFTRLRSMANDLNRENCVGSISGAVAKKIKRWVRTIPAEKLTFYALTLPKQPWRELADIIHLNPKTDFQCPFLEIAFESTPAPGSMLAECATLDPENCVDIARKWKVPYSYLRLQVKPLPDAAKPVIAEYASLDTLIWYHEELACAQVDAAIAQRLQNGERPKFGYGKLMERLLYMKRAGVGAYKLLEPVADRALRSLHLSLESPVAVLGDASFSMDVAIRCATIIGSVLALLTNADLKFFHSQCFLPAVTPRSVAQVLRVATETKATGLTAPACALLDYYNQKKVVKFFIVVTDEIENEKFKGYYFPTLFQKYHKEVFPSKIVFVSFLGSPSEKGRMYQALENMGLSPLLFRLDANRPDLQKLDSLLGQLATESSVFVTQIGKLAAQVHADGLRAVIQAEKAVGKPGDDDVIIATDSSASSALEETNVEGARAGIEGLKVSAEEEKEKDKGKGKARAEPKKLCVVCEEKETDTVLLECGHFILCGGCAVAVVEKNSCPLCRAPIARSLKVYHNI